MGQFAKPFPHSPCKATLFQLFMQQIAPENFLNAVLGIGQKGVHSRLKSLDSRALFMGGTDRP